MGNEHISKSRRHFLKQAGTAATIAPVILIGHSGKVFADELPHLSEDNPQARALGYLHDSEKVDQGKYANHNKEQRCGNCQLIQGQDDQEWRACAIFPGQAVNNKGWCSAWSKKL